MTFTAEDALGTEQFNALDEETRKELEAVTTGDGTCAPVAGFLVRACAAGGSINFPPPASFWSHGVMVVVFDDEIKVTEVLLLSAPCIPLGYQGSGARLDTFRQLAGVITMDLPDDARREWEEGLFNENGSPTPLCTALKAKRAAYSEGHRSAAAEPSAAAGP